MYFKNSKELDAIPNQSGNSEEDLAIQCSEEHQQRFLNSVGSNIQKIPQGAFLKHRVSLMQMFCHSSGL